MNLKQSLFATTLACLLLATVSSNAADEKPHDYDRWEKSISQFEKQDEKQGIQKGGVLFVGSSSIRLWDLDKYFPELKATNRGFGGSEIVDSTHFADRIILKHEPKVIFLYAGDNDLSRGRSPEAVATDFKQFVKTVHKELPKTRIVFICVKPSLSRWKLADKIVEANQLIEKQCQENELLDYADVWAPMLTKEGKPRPELFRNDGLHLNHEGYLVWKKAVEPYLNQK